MAEVEFRAIYLARSLGRVITGISDRFPGALRRNSTRWVSLRDPPGWVYRYPATKLLSNTRDLPLEIPKYSGADSLYGEHKSDITGIGNRNVISLHDNSAYNQVHVFVPLYMGFIYLVMQT